MWFNYAKALLGLCVLGSRLIGAQEENNFDDNPSFRKVGSKAYSISRPYLDSELGNRWFDFGGDTVVRTDRFIRLTSDRQSQRGWLFSRTPIAATNFQVEVEFAIYGDGYLHGDGLAIWLTKEHGTIGPVFGSQDKFEGLGIFIDTYKNGRSSNPFPYVVAMMGDGHTMYDNDNDGKANEIAGCPARNIRGSQPSVARLTYFQDKYLALDLKYRNEDEWRQCFRLEATENRPIKIPSTAYLGFSAETGDLSDNHDIVSVTTSSIYPVGNQNGMPTRRGSSKRGSKASHGGWIWFLFKCFLFLALCAGGYAGYTSYRVKQRRYAMF